MNNFNDLINKRNELKVLLIEQQKKVFQIENEIISIEKQLASFNDDLILENLKLSQQQDDIVNAIEDNILVVACPGSGKTHTLISRYVKMILNNETTPEETLLITFTKKAGLEMLNRLEKILPLKIPYHVGSLHGLAYKVLQNNNIINHVILDERDTSLYLKDLINNTDITTHLTCDEVNMIKNKIQTIIDEASTNYPFNIKITLKKYNLEKYTKEFNNIYKLYQRRKHKEGLIDFNDLMLLFSKFLDGTKSNNFKSKIKYIFFDEYQDINPIQNFILYKLSLQSKIMVVGDDAQAIYAFRGSSVKYILNFNQLFHQENKTQKTYLLEENYRSTPSIVNFSQDIILHNKNQFNKKVIAKQDKNGLKPCIYGFNSQKDEYKWLVEDIIKKNQEGIKFSDMVILARKNNLLDEIELYLLSKKIPIIKHIGLSVLNKAHVKDFLAFITILINPSSSIHLKRIINLHPNMTINKTNEIIDNNNDIINALKNYNELIELYNNIQKLNIIKKDIDKAKFIINYLEHIWIANKEPNINDRIVDLNNLLNYLKHSSLVDFINDLYLNQEVETNFENVLYLSTIHGIKGLEYKLVYIIDVDNKNFSFIRPKYYLDELEEMNEERRLLYVAATRAKKYLYITYVENNQQQISPLLKEINSELYIGCNVKIEKFKPSLIINKDIHNYLQTIGHFKIYDLLSKLINNRYYLHKTLIIPKEIDKIIINNFFKYLVIKMVQVNFTKKIIKFDFNQQSLPEKIYLDFIDSQNDWRNLLNNIFYISNYKKNNNENNNSILVADNMFNYYLNIEKGIIQLINNLKPKEIFCNYTTIFGSVKAEINILCDNTIIIIKSIINNETVTLSTLSQILLDAYILTKRNHHINNIIIYNPINGEINNFDLSQFNLIEFKKSIYN